MNTMYAAVSQRSCEIGCLLAMGFAPGDLAGFMVESPCSPARRGLAAASMAFDGMQTGMTNWATFSETAFEFAVTPGILAAAALVSVAMGFVGGVLPAFRAARMKVVDALRRA